ncbi:MAG: TRAP transporter permease [Rhodospirillales bacterium]
MAEQGKAATPIPGGLASETIQAESARAPHPILKRSTDAFAAALTLVCLAWALELPQRMGYAFYTEQFLGLVLGLALSTAFHGVSWKGKRQGGLPILDMAIGWVAFATGAWIAVEYPRLLLEVSFRTPEILTLSAIVLVLTLEALRRCTGWALLSVVCLFLAYASVAHLMPDALRGKPVKLDALISYLAFDPSALLGTPLTIGATVVLMFIWMGEVLLRSGGGDFFMDLCLAGFGRARGGPAKVGVVGSAMFGMISGSAVSNVVSSGVLTIPMMKRTGYSAQNAGAIEAVASTGGQLAPPVMGAAAFLMAEFLQIEYADVALAAALPAVLFYMGLYFQVDLLAGKYKLTRLNDKLPVVAEVLRDGWHLILPFAVLLFMMFFMESEPEVAAIYTAVTIFVVGALRPYRGKRIRLPDLYGSLASTGRTTSDLFTTVAAAGIVIGILNTTGLAFALTLFLVKIGGESIVILLLITAVISIILGMGMPTTAVYVLLATLIAPSLVQAGLNKMSAHMFIIYFGMLSMITPPVALAAFAASNISGAGAMMTAAAACRIGWAMFVVPFIFVISPGILLMGSVFHVVFDTFSALVGIHFVTAAMVGYLWRDLSATKRALLTVAGILAVVPGTTVAGVSIVPFSIGAIVVGLTVYLLEYLVRRSSRPAEAAAQ